MLHVSNPSASAVDLTLSIGADAATTRVIDGLSIPADSVRSRSVYWSLNEGDIVQAYGSTTSVLNLTLSGVEGITS